MDITFAVETKWRFSGRISGYGDNFCAASIADTKGHLVANN
jgi:hypothetical protein